jgi:multiple sugar transport system ATP-binding protein
MTVYENMAFGLKLHKVGKSEIRSRVVSAAKMLELDDLLKRKPAQLSGGQRQRVAMGRAIVREPAAYLMDEPLSNLDAKLRVEMRTYLAALHKRLRTTTLYVTHDQTEAMTMGDRVAVMRDGRLEQVDTPVCLYERPVNVFVAGFIGSPAMNLLRGRVGDGWITLGTQRLRLARRTSFAGDVIVGIRPEAVVPVGTAGDDVLELRVVLAEMLGSDVLLHLHSEAESVLGEETDRFVARVPPDLRPSAGETVRLRVDMDRVHLFDPVTERSIPDPD